MKNQIWNGMETRKVKKSAAGWTNRTPSRRTDAQVEDQREEHDALPAGGEQRRLLPEAQTLVEMVHIVGVGEDRDDIARIEERPAGDRDDVRIVSEPADDLRPVQKTSDPVIRQMTVPTMRAKPKASFTRAFLPAP